MVVRWRNFVFIRFRFSHDCVPRWTPAILLLRFVRFNRLDMLFSALLFYRSRCASPVAYGWFLGRKIPICFFFFLNCFFRTPYTLCIDRFHTKRRLDTFFVRNTGYSLFLWSGGWRGCNIIITIIIIIVIIIIVIGAHISQAIGERARVIAREIRQRKIYRRTIVKISEFSRILGGRWRSGVGGEGRAVAFFRYTWNDSRPTTRGQYIYISRTRPEPGHVNGQYWNNVSRRHDTPRPV